MSLEDLRREFESEVIGQLWLQEVHVCCQRVVRSYAPAVYGQVDDWKDGLEDLVQDVMVTRLIEEGQAAYLLAVSASLEDLRRLLRLQVTRTLSRRRTRTVVDQLLSRAVLILQGPGFDEVQVGGGTAWHASGATLPMRSLSSRELSVAATAVRTIPTVVGDGTERASPVYRTPDLDRLLRVVADVLPAPFNRRDLDEIFRRLLTPFLPSVLEERVPGAGTFSALSADQEHDVTVTANRILKALNDEQRVILAAKLSGAADADLAAHLGYSRPTVAKRRQGVLDVMASSGLRELPEDLRVLVMDQLGLALAGTWRGAS